jgi:hypothetical protein
MFFCARLAAVLALGASVVLLASACGDDPPPPESAGQACTAPGQCYPNVEAGALQGEVQCLTRVQGGYCTHLCQTDADCCAVPGECSGAYKQVCSPFESTGQMMCFLSCEAADITASGAQTTDSNAYCNTYANQAFNCRSSGGGSANRKVCVP